ncbi:pentatricopeptide repeat-containing protein At1g76280 isoform X3 [Syzygium oleosum]|uniref:pentatricopeptide repeat-containing protein At1g76280 isoform X3 n=1 Tax=Syzygium oleosum TaxID=219896 RepID=UPI0024BB9850|nr:pentatricopeptide repeat-containing protein At1g76280 isoform X3 [Syzygium oleosum]
MASEALGRKVWSSAGGLRRLEGVRSGGDERRFGARSPILSRRRASAGEDRMRAAPPSSSSAPRTSSLAQSGESAIAFGWTRHLRARAGGGGVIGNNPWGRKNITDKEYMYRTHATSGADQCFGHQIVDALQLGDRTGASNLLSYLGYENQSLQADDVVHILDYCARSSDASFAMETWKLINEKKISIGERCHILTLQALCKAGCLAVGLNLLSNLGENHHVTHFLDAYNYFLRACVVVQSELYADCLDLMEHRLVGKNEATYLELLEIAVWKQNLFAVHHIWKDYSKHYNLGLTSLRKFIWSFTRLRDLKSAYESLQLMVALATGGTLSIRYAERGLHPPKLDIPIPSMSELQLARFDTEETEHICDKEDGLARNLGLCTTYGPRNEVMCVGIDTPNPKYLALKNVLSRSFTDVICTCALTSNNSLAEQLFQQMQNLGLQPSSRTYDGFIRAIVTERGFSDGLELLKIMQKQKLKPFDSTLATISVKCSEALELDFAEDLLVQISECPHPYPFNVFLAACNAMHERPMVCIMQDQPERAVHVLARMKQIQLKPNIQTYELLFSLFGTVNAPYEEGNMLSQVEAAKRIEAIEMDMAKNGVEHSLISLKNLLAALGQEGMIEKMLRVVESRFVCSGTSVEAPLYNVVLHSLVAAKESRKAVDIFKDMKQRGFSPDPATYCIMIDCCSIIQCYRSACALVSMMIRDGFYPGTITYTALIKVLLVSENYDEALNLLDQAKAERIQFDLLLFNTFLLKACEMGRLDVLEHIVELIHQENFQPNPSSCCYVYTAYVNNGFYSTAIEALRVLSMRMICQADNPPQEMMAEYEDFIFSEDPDAESYLTGFFENNQDDLAFALLNLRWCAIEGMPIDWLPEQSPWAQRLARCTQE